MNHTIHTHQVIHAFAHKDDDKQIRIRSRGNGAVRARESGTKRMRRVDARGIVTTVIILFPLIVAEVLIGDIATDAWFAAVLDQTSQLLALASPF